MPSRIAAVLAAVLAAALGAQTPKVQFWVGFQPRIWELPPPVFRLTSPPEYRLPVFGRADRKDRIPSAVVEVWGNASWTREDDFKAFVRANLPQFRTAFDAGLGAGVGGAMLADLMNHPEDLHRSPLVAPPVWFNSVDPWARDRRYYR